MSNTIKTSTNRIELKKTKANTFCADAGYKHLYITDNDKCETVKTSYHQELSDTIMAMSWQAIYSPTGKLKWFQRGCGGVYDKLFHKHFGDGSTIALHKAVLAYTIGDGSVKAGLKLIEREKAIANEPLEIDHVMEYGYTNDDSPTNLVLIPKSWNRRKVIYKKGVESLPHGFHAIFNHDIRCWVVSFITPNNAEGIVAYIPYEQFDEFLTLRNLFINVGYEATRKYAKLNTDTQKMTVLPSGDEDMTAFLCRNFC